jgi:phosphopantetheinyl transferase (holo-ACP synthase)
VERVCDEAERARVRSRADLWRIFAAKEAAYKALVKMGAAPGFGHRTIRVAEDLAAVTWQDLRVSLSVTDDAEHVHAVAWSAGRTPLASVVAFEGVADDASAESARAYTVLCRLVALEVGCTPEELRVAREPMPGAWDGFGPPRVLRCEIALDVDVSLSHDGRFAAAASSRHA